MFKRKSILIVSPYVTFPDEPGANRFISIANMLSSYYDVTLVTSNFCHILKAQRHKVYQNSRFKTILLNETGYKKNVSISRLLSHKIFCNNFQTFLKVNGYKFDLIYSAFPLIYTNFLLGKYKDKFKYKLIIDVQDTWPDSIAGPIPLLASPVGKLVLFPINKYANKTYSYADGLVAVSNTYLNRADITNLPSNRKKVVYIGTDRKLDTNSYNYSSKENQPLLAIYIGTMAGSYDLETIVRAAALCKGKVKIEFIGTGEDENKLKNLNSKLGNNVNFLGLLPYKDAMNKLAKADIAINPIKEKAAASITNKLSDYLALGLPILSCQNNKEVIDLLTANGNFHYTSGNSRELASKLLYIENHRSILAAVSQKNFLFAKENLSRDISYTEIFNLIETVLEL